MLLTALHSLDILGLQDPIGESILNDQDDGGHINKRGKVEPPDGADEDAEGEEDDGSPAVRFTRSGRRSQHVSYAEPDDDDDDDDVKPRRRTASRTSKSLADVSISADCPFHLLNGY